MTKIDHLRKVANGAHIHLVNKAQMYYDCWLNGSWAIKQNDKKFKELDIAIDKAIMGNWEELQTILKFLW